VTTFERLIALEGAVNFRDLGGYATDHGRHTRWRVLFRADGLGELTVDDLAIMRELGIRTVVDLRSGHEVEQSRFDVDAHPVDFHHFPFIDALPDAGAFDRAPGFLAKQYTEMLDGASSQIAGALLALAAEDAQPAVFHCTAGKDRTGLLSALILALVGVPEETVIADYALSGEAMARLQAKLVLKYPDSEEVLPLTNAVFSADPDNMTSLFAHLHDRYGTIEAYATTIGVDAAAVDRLREILLDPAI
jgi:protein-tyrosine phosphatase